MLYVNANVAGRALNPNVIASGKPATQVADEIGYERLGRQEATLFFRFVSQRAESTRLIAASNKGFDEGGVRRGHRPRRGDSGQAHILQRDHLSSITWHVEKILNLVLGVVGLCFLKLLIDLVQNAVAFGNHARELLIQLFIYD